MQIPNRVRIVRYQLFQAYRPPLRQLEERGLSLEGYEALRLADREGLNMDEAAQHMGVSNHTFGRILQKDRHAVAEASVLGRALRVEGGTYKLGGHDTLDATPAGQPLSSSEDRHG